MSDLQPNEFRCAMCGHVYTKAWSDAEAEAEMQSYWPGLPQVEAAVICDDCYQKVAPASHPAEYLDSLAEHAANILQQQVEQAKVEMLKRYPPGKGNLLGEMTTEEKARILNEMFPMFRFRVRNKEEDQP